MNINIRGHEIELFETERDWLNYIKDYKPRCEYSGNLNSMPESVWHNVLGFQNLTDLIISVKKQCYNHIEYMIIK